MTAYFFGYRLGTRPAGRLDGSAQVAHEIEAISSPDEEVWSPVPGHNKTILIPGASLTIVLDMPDSTGPQRQAKNQAYKDLLVASRNVQPDPMVKTWTPESLQLFMDANDSSALQAQRANDYITVTLGQIYPVDFNL